ncbi:acyl-CoA carboxylase epsilon subunit [Streptomyces sp. NPDC047081]|uniref:acyl-CoA carboxylase epsilon subunit n=1 Tax=Streptomyces sp. NPDC047081 TaxID=3154706 RepID=UPI0033EC1547
MTSLPDTAVPTIQVRRGQAIPEELAALVAVLVARAGAAEPARPPRHRVPNWQRLERALRHSGARGWGRERGAGRPHSASSPGRA